MPAAFQDDRKNGLVFERPRRVCMALLTRSAPEIIPLEEA